MRKGSCHPYLYYLPSYIYSTNNSDKKADTHLIVSIGLFCYLGYNVQKTGFVGLCSLVSLNLHIESRMIKMYYDYSIQTIKL